MPLTKQFNQLDPINNGTSAVNNFKLSDSIPAQHSDVTGGVNKLVKRTFAQMLCEPVAVSNSNNPSNGAYTAICQNYPDFAVSYQDEQMSTHYYVGLKIRVIFNYGITYGSVSGGTYPTLNINSSGALPLLAQGKTMAAGAASNGQSLELTLIPYGNGYAWDADSNVRESTSDYTIYTNGKKGVNITTYNSCYYEQKSLATQGWYRLATCNIRVAGTLIEIDITTSYFYQKPVSKKIIIGIGWSSSDIQVLDNIDEDGAITKIRTIQEGSSLNRNLYIDIYYSTNQSNPIFVYLTCKNKEITVNNFDKITETPTGTVTEKNI